MTFVTRWQHSPAVPFSLSLPLPEFNLVLHSYRLAFRPWFLILLLLPIAGTSLAETRLLRFPDLHGDRVVFSHGGDLWSAPVDGGTAFRLTAHEGLELFPKFSPDGRWIAFTAQYGGDEQVYVMPTSGGEPRQLTWYPANGPLPPRWGYDNQVYGWTPDGEAVVFRSQRDAWGSSTARLYTVSMQGDSLPEALPMPVSGAGTFTDDGEHVFYSPLFRDFRTWKRYEGGWAQDLWLFDLDTNEARRVTEHARTDRDPMWLNGQAHFVSDRDGKLNLYRIDPDSGEAEQLTAHEEFDVRWASAGPADRIVYELGGGLRVFDTRSGMDAGIEIRVPDDGVGTRERTVDVSGQIHGARLSPTGQRVLFEARGNLFNVPAGDGIARNLTNRSSAHDREADWSPDGQTIVFVSDAGGEEELHIVPADGSETPQALTSGNRTRFYRPRFSPDGEHIAVSDKDGFIYVVRADGSGEMEQVARDAGWRNRDYTWSPAGDWLAFSLTEETGLRALHLYGVADGQTRRLSEGLFSEYQPVFSPDGSALYFLADREFAPQISGREWNYATNRMTGIYAYLLDPEADNPFAPEDAEEAGLDAEKPDGDKEEGGENDRTVIEFDGLKERLVRVPLEPGNFTQLIVAENGIVFGERDAFYYGREGALTPRLKLFKFDDNKVATLVRGTSSADVSLDARRLLVRENGAWKVYDIAKEGKESESVSTDALQARIDPRQEWATIFDEVWRRFRDYFYVDNMHGYEWEGLRERYRPLLEHVAHRSDLNYLMGEMISELNVSHAYVSGGDEGLPERPDVALLGARFEVDQGHYRIHRILEGQNDEPRYRSPLTAAGLDVEAGDYLLAVNGRSLTAGDNIYRRLTLPSGQALALTVASDVDGSDAREVLVEPIDDESRLFYLGWVLDNHRRVSEATDGRVGYLHIPDMGPDGIREFIKWFYGQIRKDGLVIDVRSNGGGNVSQMLIERLSRKPLSLGYSRTMPHVSTYPNQAFNGHMAAILDENSASDGDIFPWQFRNAGLGPLIGKKSWGGVIGITSHGPVIDGGSVNVPEFGFLDVDGEWVIEGEGVEPDIEVENDPASVIAGEDPQLERAIEEVMKQIEADPPRFPERPEPPVKTN